MILTDRKVFCPDITLYKELKSNSDYVIASGNLTLYADKVLEKMSLQPDHQHKCEITVPRIIYQRDGSWTATDRNDLLNSICQGLGTNLYHMWYRGGQAGPALLTIMDGANRLETQRAFSYDERIMMPSGKETARLKVKCDLQDENALPSLYKELPEPVKDMFEYHRINTQIFFVLDKNNGTANIDLDRQVVLGNTYALQDCAEIIVGSDEEAECTAFCAAQFIAFNKGKQNDNQENRRARAETSGQLSKAIDGICKEFGGNLYGFKVKRAKKGEYIAQMAYTLWNGENEFIGTPRGKEKQLDDLYIIHKKKNNDSDKLIRELHFTIDNLKKTNNIYNSKLVSMTNESKSFATGDCFTSSDGWILTSFMFNEVFKNYVVKKDEDYIEVGQMCSNIYSDVQKVTALAKGTGILDLEKPNEKTPQLERIAFDWYYAKIKHNGSGSKPHAEKWKLMQEMVAASNLTPLCARKTTWSDNTYSILLDKAAYTCRVMNTPISRESCEITHKVALEDGGTNELDNLEALSPEGHAEIDPHRHLKAA